KPYFDVTVATLTYTHWEVFLARFRDIPVFVFDASRDITDGHPRDQAPFEPDARDTDWMKAHRERLKRIRRYTEEFVDYDSLKNAIFKTLYSDANREIRRLRDELEQLASALDREAEDRTQRRTRFGANTVNELKAVLGRYPDLGTPAFLT